MTRIDLNAYLQPLRGRRTCGQKSPCHPTVLRRTVRRAVHRSRWNFLWTGFFLAIGCLTATAEPTATKNSASALADGPSKLLAPQLPAPKSGQPMPKPHQVWIDVVKKQVVIDGYVSLNAGLLEMFACPSGTKEHESIVAVYSSAQVVHTALLAIGAKVGHPVQWRPDFQPPTGTEIEIDVRWLDADGKWQSSPAQQWLTDLKTNQPMTHAWVFAGSGFWKDEATGQEYYLAEAGDLICVSNFSSATLDIPVKSSQANAGLMFEANTEKIPAVGTPVRLVLKLKMKPKKKK